jgi:hypothetical protein
MRGEGHEAILLSQEKISEHTILRAAELLRCERAAVSSDNRQMDARNRQILPAAW